MPSGDVDSIDDISKRELKRAKDRIRSQSKPLVQAAFDRLHDAHPEFERIRFGNHMIKFLTWLSNNDKRAGMCEL